MSDLHRLTLDVDTPQGPGRWLVSPADGDPTMVLLLGHGAGGGLDGIDLVALATHLPAHGITVARFDQPWHVAGRKIAGRPDTLDQAWLAGVEHLIDDAGLGLARVPVVVAGHSAGARVACRTAGQVGASAVVGLSFPLHPPGKPDKSRLDELLNPQVPVLVVQGDRDPFGSADEVVAALAASPKGQPAHIQVAAVVGAAHALAVPARVRTAPDHRRHLAEVVMSFLTTLPRT